MRKDEGAYRCGLSRDDTSEVNDPQPDTAGSSDIAHSQPVSLLEVTVGKASQY